MLNRTAVQLLVAIFVPILLALLLFTAFGWMRAGAGVAVAAVAGVGLALHRRLRRRPWKLLVVAAILSLVFGLIAHLLARQTVVIENQSGQTAWLWLSARDQGDREEVIQLSGLRAGATFRFSFEGPFFCHGVAVAEGALRDRTALTNDDSADSFYQTLHHFTRIHISEHGICHFSSE